MTTTAEKIKVMQEQIDALDCRLDLLKKDLALLRFPELNPPDPELLECWVSFVNRMPTHIQPFPFAAGIRMREVTPQGEQDRKDAARYRWLIENGYNEEKVLWSNIIQWDEIIDKEMEQK